MDKRQSIRIRVHCPSKYHWAPFNLFTTVFTYLVICNFGGEGEGVEEEEEEEERGAGDRKGEGEGWGG